MIHHLIDSTRVVGVTELVGERFEVCAEAVGRHDRGENLLTVELRAFLRAASPGHLGEVAHPDWLPATQELREAVGVEEAHEMVDDIFRSWCRKVAAAIP